jgi:hypothetical protein
MIIELLLAAAVESKSFDQLISHYGLPLSGTYDSKADTTTFGFCHSGEVAYYIYYWPQKNLRRLPESEAPGNACCMCKIQSESHSREIHDELSRNLSDEECDGEYARSIVAMTRKYGPPWSITSDCNCELKRCSCSGTLQKWTFGRGPFFNVFVNECAGKSLGKGEA